MFFFNLNNNNSIPSLGIGTYRNTSYKNLLTVFKEAFDKGIFLIDTAEMYGNESEIGKAIKDLKIERDKLFITSKVWNSQQGYDSTIKSFENSLKKLKTDYLDLYLIHWPVSDKFQETWKALEYLYKKGLAKNIGVSNFHIHHLKKLFETAEIIPAVNQIELHPYMHQDEILNYCNEKEIVIEAWSPIAKGRVANDNLLIKIGQKYNKTAVQVSLRWEIQKGIVTIPKSSKPERIAEFANIFDFELTKDEMTMVSKLNNNSRIGPNPDNFDF